MANFLPFKLMQKKEYDEFAFKGIMGNEDLHTDEQGRHLIFRTIGGRVRPIRVGAEDFAEWLLNQGVSINPADQKTLRELDRELEIMERAAEYGGPALQKQYENYFKQRREEYAKIALLYYQQALQNQASQVGVTPEQALQYKQQNVPAELPARRESSERRGWGEAFQSWVEGQDRTNGLTPANDQWYYNRIYGVILMDLSLLAEKKVPLSSLNLEKILSDEFLKHAIQSNYDMFFANQGADHKKTAAAINTMRKNFKDNIRGDRKRIENFISYWYNKMSRDFAREDEMTLATSPVTEGVREVPDNVIPSELPQTFNNEEVSSLIGMYSSASGSKLNAAHRVMLHGFGRLLDSIPLKERVSAAVELSNGKTGLNAVHKEGYKRAYVEATSLGLIPDRDELVREALQTAARSASGTTKQKISAMKKLALIMGTIDGTAVINSNPGIQESQFNRKWHDTAINAGRTRSEGPGLIDILMDDDKRNSHIYTNQDLKIIHSPTQAEPSLVVTPTASPAVNAADSDLISDDDISDEVASHSFSGTKMILSDGFTAEFSQSGQGYLDVLVSSPDNSQQYSFELRVAKPPIPISNMDDAGKDSYLSYVKKEIEKEIQGYKNALPKSDSDDSYESSDAGTFRIPLFDFSENLTTEDRDFLGQVIQHVDEGGLEVKKLMEGVYRIVNPANNKTFDIMMNKSRKKLVALGIDSEGNKVPFTSPSIQDFSSSIEYRSSE